MKEVILYDKFFREEDIGVSYENTKAYVDDLFYVLDGFIQVAFAMNGKEGGDIDYLIADVLKMENQIEHRRQKSNNRLIWMEEIFSLSRFERFLLILSMSIFKHPVYESYYISLQNNSNMMYPTKGLALFLYGIIYNLNEGEKENLIFDENLTAKLLMDLSKSRHTFTDIICPAEGLVQYILYGSESYVFQKDFNQIVYPKQMNLFKDMHQEVQEQLFCIYEKSDLWNRIVQINGKSGSGKKYIVRCFARNIKKKILFISSDQFLESSKKSAMDMLHKLYANVRIMDAIPCFLIKSEHVKELPYVLTEAEQMFSFCIVLTEDGQKQVLLKTKSYIRFNIPPLLPADRLFLWETYSHGIVYEKDVDLQLLVNKYYANAGDIQNLIETARACSIAKNKKTIGNAEIAKAFRLRQQSSFNQIASRINAAYTWEDLIVSASLKQQLNRICGQIRYRDVVEEQWGFLEKLPYGKGIGVMFGGPPGTGKTMAAQIMANELGMELYRIDLSMIYNKYIGETEKNISGLFENAKNMNAILFFDEADALFAKRSDVKSSNDRNANGVTAHLLQKMEEYDGVVILASNLPQSLDDAFRRRLKFIIPFDYPDEALRLQLYQTILPKKAECGEFLDFAYYARHFEMSGSSIKEVLVNAAYIAAEEGEGIRNKHLIESIRQNYSKYGKVLTEEDFGYLSHL